MISAVDRITIAVDDLKAATRDFVDVLGCTPSSTGRTPDDGTENVIFRLDNTCVELLSPVAPGELADALRARIDAEGEGLFELGLATQDADDAVQRLRARGLTVRDPADRLAQDGPSGAFRRYRQALISERDSRGIRLSLIEHRSLPEELPPALPLADRSASADRIDHVVVLSRQPDRTKALYADALEIRLALDRTFEARGVRLLFFRVGGLTIEIGSQLSKGADLASPAADDDQLWGLALSVEDIERARARLREAGVATSDIRAGHKSGTRVFTVKDRTHGVATLVIQPVRDVEAS